MESIAANLASNIEAMNLIAVLNKTQRVILTLADATKLKEAPFAAAQICMQAVRKLGPDVINQEQLRDESREYERTEIREQSVDSSDSSEYETDSSDDSDTELRTEPTGREVKESVEDPKESRPDSMLQQFLQGLPKLREAGGVSSDSDADDRKTRELVRLRARCQLLEERVQQTELRDEEQVLKDMYGTPSLPPAPEGARKSLESAQQKRAQKVLHNAGEAQTLMGDFFVASCRAVGRGERFASNFRQKLNSATHSDVMRESMAELYDSEELQVMANPKTTLALAIGRALVESAGRKKPSYRTARGDIHDTEQFRQYQQRKRIAATTLLMKRNKAG